MPPPCPLQEFGKFMKGTFVPTVDLQDALGRRQSLLGRPQHALYVGLQPAGGNHEADR